MLGCTQGINVWTQETLVHDQYRLLAQVSFIYVALQSRLCQGAQRDQMCGLNNKVFQNFSDLKMTYNLWLKFWPFPNFNHKLFKFTTVRYQCFNSMSRTVKEKNVVRICEYWFRQRLHCDEL